jgi:hypothetical protein
MFVAFPYLLPPLGFWWALAASILITLACFAKFALGARAFGVELL